METPRPYAQRLRAESAAQTRLRILDSVYDRLRQSPAERLAVDRVARDAGVSRSTVYLIFGDRSGLFDAVGADLLDRGGFADVLAAVDNPDARAAMRAFMRATVDMYAASRDVLRSLYSMAQLDPEAVGGAIARLEKGRLEGMQRVAAGLAAAGELRDDVTVDEATDVLWLLSSFDSFDLLHHGRGRTAGSVAATLTRAVEQSILAA